MYPQWSAPSPGRVYCKLEFIGLLPPEALTDGTDGFRPGPPDPNWAREGGAVFGPYSDQKDDADIRGYSRRSAAAFPTPESA
jgi:hypothetical protein